VVEPSGSWKVTALRSDHFLTERPESVSLSIDVDDTVTFTASPQNEMIRKSSYTFSSGTELSGFDPRESDKLVATLSHENSEIAEVTYGGVRMSLGARSDTSVWLQTAIYYLDSPGSAGDLVVVFKGKGRAPNGVGGSLLALSNTTSGKPAVVAKSSARSVQVTTKMNHSLVVVSHVSNDHAADAAPTAQAPMNPLFGAPVGSSAGGSGYMLVESTGMVKPIFSGAGLEPITLGVAFAPRP
jgi:hypothetical protein